MSRSAANPSAATHIPQVTAQRWIRTNDSLFAAVVEVVEQGDAIGLGPYANFAGILESCVIPFQRFFAVVGHGEMAGLEIDTQSVPLAGGDFPVGSFLFRAAAVDGVVNGDVVFERIGARDVVVVGITGSPDQAAGAIFTAGYGFELHFDIAVFQAGVVLDADRISSLAGLFEDVGLAGRGIVLFDGPLRRARAGFGGGPAGRRRAGGSIIEIHGVGNCAGRERTDYDEAGEVHTTSLRFLCPRRCAVQGKTHAKRRSFAWLAL